MEWYKLFGFPVRWFFDKYDQCKQEGNILKILLLFLVSLSGVALLGGVTIWLIIYLITQKPEWCVIAGLIFWLYAYVRSKMKKENSAQPPAVSNTLPNIEANLKQLEKQATAEYARMRTIMFIALQNLAPSIGGKVPRVLSEIEIHGEHTVTDKCIKVCFHQFKVTKEDTQMQYSLTELIEFKDYFQRELERMISEGKFPTLHLQSYQTIYGNFLCGVTIDTIEDLETHLIISTVFPTPAYADYFHQTQINQQNNVESNIIPDASWNDADI